MGTDSFIEIRDAYKEATQALIAELVRVENKTEQLVARLEAKNESAFDKIHVQVGELKPKRVSLFQIIASLFGVVIFVGSVIWTLSRYPTGDDFEKISASMNRVELRLAIQQRDIDDLKKAVQKP